MSEVTKKIKVALVGCGRISKNHFEAIAAHSENLELVGVCDTYVERLNECKLKYSVPGFDSIDSLIDETTPDLLVVTTPSGMHPEHSITALNKKVHVLCEKPMATKYDEAIKMVDAAKKNERELFIVKQNRKNKTIQLLKKALDQNRFGKIYFIQSNVFWTRPQEYFDMAPWRGTHDMDGGVFFNQASHYVDLLTWLFGPVSKINAFYETHARKIETEDTGVWSMKWASGAVGSLNVTMLTYPKNLEGSITVIGEKGTAVIGGVAVNEVKVWDFEEALEDDEDIKSASYETKSVYGFGHSLYYKNVVDTLLGNSAADTNGAEGLRSLELLVAAKKSAAEGRAYDLPLERG